MIQPAIYAKLPYDTRRDFSGITTTATASYMLVVSMSVPAKSVQDLITLARANPGQLNFSSAGTGSATHFAGELLKVSAQIDVVHIPYKGVPEAVADVVAGRVQFIMSGARNESNAAWTDWGRLRRLPTCRPPADE